MKPLLKELLGLPCVILLMIIARIPEKLLFKILLPLVPVYNLFRSRHTRKVSRLFRAAPFELNLRDYYRVRLRLLLHTIKHHGSMALPPRTVVRGGEYLKGVVRTRCPIVLLGLHQGPFEWQHVSPLELLNPDGRKLRVVTAPAFSSILNRYMTLGRTRPGKVTIPNHNITRELPDILRSQGVLAIMADQSPRREGKKVTLWGRIETPVSPGILKSFLDRGGAILPISSELDQNDIVHISYHKPLRAMDEGSKKIEIGEINVFLQNFLESSITLNPLQWNWSYPGLKINRQQNRTVVASTQKKRLKSTRIPA